MHPRLHVIRDDDMQCAFNGKHCSCCTWTFAITRSFRISRFQTKCASSIKFNPFDLRYGFSERSRHGAFGAIVRCDQLRRDQKIQWTKYYIRFTLLIILDSPVLHRRRHIIAFDYARSSHTCGGCMCSVWCESVQSCRRRRCRYHHIRAGSKCSNRFVRSHSRSDEVCCR